MYNILIVLINLLGPATEIIYFIMYICCVKDIKEKRLWLSIGITISYLLCITVKRYEIIYYICFIVSMFLVLKILYGKKTQLADIFVISVSTIYTTILATISMILITQKYENYYYIFILNRILLFLPFIFKDKMNKLYKEYCHLWNRNKAEKRPIKSITLRNITLISANIFIFILNILSIFIISWK